MKNIRLYLSFLLLLFWSVQLGAESRVLRGLTAVDGLIDLTITTIHKDSAGFVWLGTGSSVERFDGVFLKHYALTGTDARRTWVYALAELAGHDIWMGNGTGLWRLNKQTETFERMVPDVIHGPVLSLVSDGQGTLYIGSERGLYIYRNGKFSHRLLDSSTFSVANQITDMALDGEGQLWMATRHGLYALALADNQVRHWHNEVGADHVCSFNKLALVGSQIYLGTTDRGIVRFDRRSKSFSPYVSVGCNVIMSLSGDGERMLYVGTDGNGVHFIDTERGEVVRSLRHEAGNEGSLRSNSVYSLLVDREGIVWAGFYQSGLDYTLYQGDTFTTYSFPPYFHSKDVPVRAVAIQGDEKLIGSREGLFYIHEAKNLFRVFNTPQIRSGMVFCIHRFEGRYLVGTYGGGMHVIDPATLEPADFLEEEPFLNGHIFCMAEDAEHTLWIGTSDGVFCYRDGRVTAHYTSTNSKLPAGNVYEIFFDSNRRGWISTENGLCLWEPTSGSLRTDVFPEGFIHKEKIRVVYEDSAHQLYFFPDKGALFFSDLSMNHFHYLQPGTPLEGRDGMFIIEDRNKGLWMGTNDGLFYYDKEENFVPYDFMDGIPASMFTLCPPVCDEKGNFWFGNSKGLLLLDADRVGEKVGGTYPVRITDVWVNGKRSVTGIEGNTKENHEVVLESFENNVTFRLSDFSYTAPTAMSYEYQLDGIDASWFMLEGKSEVTYYNLPAGRYTFKVRRIGQPDSETSLAIEVASRFPTGMAWGVCLVLSALGGGYYYYSRHRKASVAPVLLSPQDSETSESLPEEKSVQEVKYKTVKVSAEECARLAEKLEEVMLRDKPYIRSELKIADLAATLDTSAHTLSYVFNQYLKRNYYDYINDYRIAEFKRLVATGEYARYTLQALAERCGFSSRASFFRYFKKAVGITPNEYIRSLEKDEA